MREYTFKIIFADDSDGKMHNVYAFSAPEAAEAVLEAYRMEPGDSGLPCIMGIVRIDSHEHF
jgi:hypothetical protein